MERLQIVLLLFISSSWLLTCENGKSDTGKTSAFTAQLKGDTNTTAERDSCEDFYSEWLSLPFAGSGSNWMATISLVSVPENLLENARLNVYMKKYGSVFRLDYTERDSSIDYEIDHGRININSNFNPESIEFSYRLSPDGTFVNNKSIAINYATAFK